MKASQLRPVFTQCNSCVCASLNHWGYRRHSSLREEVRESAHLNRDSRQISQSLWRTNTDRWNYHVSQLFQNERRRQTRPDKRRRGDSATELPRRPEGETRQKSHEDLGESGDGYRLLYVCFSRSFLLSHLLCALLDTRWFHEHHEDNKPLVQSGIERRAALDSLELLQLFLMHYANCPNTAHLSVRITVNHYLSDSLSFLYSDFAYLKWTTDKLTFY